MKIVRYIMGKVNHPKKENFVGLLWLLLLGVIVCILLGLGSFVLLHFWSGHSIGVTANFVIK